VMTTLQTVHSARECRVQHCNVFGTDPQWQFIQMTDTDGYQAVHVRDGVTGSRFLRRNKWGKRGLTLPSVPYERSLLRRVGVGGDRRASSSRGVGRSSPNRLLGGIPSAEVDVGPYIYIIKKSTKRRVFIPFPPSVIYIL